MYTAGSNRWEGSGVWGVPRAGLINPLVMRISGTCRKTFLFSMHYENYNELKDGCFVICFVVVVVVVVLIVHVEFRLGQLKFILPSLRLRLLLLLWLYSLMILF